MDQLVQLQLLLNGYSQVYRHHYIAGTNLREDDSSHALSVALICWHYISKYSPPLSTEKILKYALIHDLVEVYAGDVITYASKDALRQKERNERRAIQRLMKEFAHEKDMLLHIKSYQDHSDEEAYFVWICDKIQAYIQAAADNWRPHVEAGITNKMFSEKLYQQKQYAPQFMKHEFDELAAQFTESFKQRPNPMTNDDR